MCVTPCPNSYYWARCSTSVTSPCRVTAMAPAVQCYFQDGLAPSTRRTYDSRMRNFGTFCEHYHVTDPFPVSEFLICAFTAYMADSGLTPQTVNSYLSAIRNTQLSLGLPDPREQSSLPVQAGHDWVAATPRESGSPQESGFQSQPPCSAVSSTNSRGRPTQSVLSYGPSVVWHSSGSSDWANCC